MMTMRLAAVAALALTAGAVVPLACSPQVVDAVEPPAQSFEDASDASDAGATCSNGGDALEDSDGDGAPDCDDECDSDPMKVEPGTCGCGLLDPLMLPDGAPSCLDLLGLLAHRYTFIGPAGSRLVVDSVAGRDGDIVDGGVSGSGTLELAGGASENYAGLPNQLISNRTSVTLEAWLRWRGGPVWQRIFDFGNTDVPEGSQSVGRTYLFLTPSTPMNETHYQSGKLRLVYKGAPGARELIAEAPIALPFGGSEPTHVAAVVDVEAKTMSVYINGELQAGRAMLAGIVQRNSAGEEVVVPYELLTENGPYDWNDPPDGGAAPPPVDLSTIVDVNDWLGRSQYQTDAELSATYYEFRVYAGALSPELIAISHLAGPDPVFLPEPGSGGD
jgi:hypothetical protein